MTEPETSGNDPTGLKRRAERDGDDWVINGRKWCTSDALGASVAIVMAVTDPDAEPHKRATMLLVPTDAPGFNMVRPLSDMGHVDGPGHWEIAYEDCRVPVAEAPSVALERLQIAPGPPRPRPHPPLHAADRRRRARWR